MQICSEHVCPENIFHYHEGIIKRVWALTEIKPVTPVYMHSRNKVAERNWVKTGNLNVFLCAAVIWQMFSLCSLYQRAVYFQGILADILKEKTAFTLGEK